MKSQFRLAAKLKQQPALKKSQSSSRGDLMLSSEMNDWLKSTMMDTDDDGMLSDKLASAALQPLDSLSVYCPSAAIMKSQYSSARISSSIENDGRSTGASLATGGTKNWKEANFTESNGILSGTLKSSQSSDATLSVDDPMIRLKVLWLKRKAMLERESGSYDSAVKSLGSAIRLHLGTDDYSKADLRGYMPPSSSDPLELLGKIESEYVIYNPTVHRSATRIQSAYRRYHKKRCVAATNLSRFYRGYTSRRFVWQRNQVRTQCATMIQRVVRAHNRRRQAKAIIIQKWYRMRKQMKAYTIMLMKQNAAKTIQNFFRNNRGRTKSILLRRLQNVLILKLQSLFRGFIVRKRRNFALSMYHKFLHSTVLVIQCAVRRMIARTRKCAYVLGELAREAKRLQHEKIYLAAQMKDEIARTKLYISSPAGKLHQLFILDSIKLRNDMIRKGKENQSLSRIDLVREEAKIAYEIINTSGTDRLTLSEININFIELKIILSLTDSQCLFDTIELYSSSKQKNNSKNIQAKNPTNNMQCKKVSDLVLNSPKNSEGTFHDGFCFETFFKFYIREKIEEEITEKEITAKEIAAKEITDYEITEEEVTENAVAEKEVTEKVLTEMEITELEITVKSEMNEIDKEANILKIKLNDSRDRGYKILEMLKKKLYFLELSGELQYVRANKLITKNNNNIQYLKSLRTFRRYAPPRFECCQCRSPFALFRQYESHFNSSGHCSISHRKGRFYKKCAIVWQKQRQCEIELIRNIAQNNFINNSMYVCWFTQLAVLNRSKKMKKIINKSVSTMLVRDNVTSPNVEHTKLSKNSDPRLLILEYIDCLSEVPSLINLIENLICTTLSWRSSLIDNTIIHNNDTHDNDRKNMKNNTININDNYTSSNIQMVTDIQIFKNWMLENLSTGEDTNYGDENRKSNEGNINVREASKEEISEIDALKITSAVNADLDIKNENMGDQQTGNEKNERKEKGKGQSLSLTRPEKNVQRTRTYDQKKVAVMNVRLLVLLRHTVSDMLSALLQFQQECPRRIEIDDSELQTLGLENLTSRNFTKIKETYAKRFSILTTRILELESTQVPWSRNVSARVNPVLTKDKYDIIVENKDKLLNDSYINAESHYFLYIKSPIGRKQIKLISEELRLSHKNIKQKNKIKRNKKKIKITKNEQNSEDENFEKKDQNFSNSKMSLRVRTKVQYLHHRLSRPCWISDRTYDPHFLGILDPVRFQTPENRMMNNQVSCNFRDFESLLNPLALRIPSNSMPEIRKKLDPDKLEEIELDPLLLFVENDEIKKYYSIIQAIKNGMKNIFRGIFGRKYVNEAREVLLLATRRKVRDQLDLLINCYLSQNREGNVNVSACGENNLEFVNTQSKTLLSQPQPLPLSLPQTVSTMLNRTPHTQKQIHTLPLQDMDSTLALNLVRARLLSELAETTLIRNNTEQNILRKNRFSNWWFHKYYNHILEQKMMIRALRDCSDSIKILHISDKKRSKFFMNFSNDPICEENVPSASFSPKNIPENLIAAGNVSGDTSVNEVRKSVTNTVLTPPPVLSINELEKLKNEELIVLLVIYLFDTNCFGDLSEDEVFGIMRFMDRTFQKNKIIGTFPGIDQHRISYRQVAFYFKEKFGNDIVQNNEKSRWNFLLFSTRKERIQFDSKAVRNSAQYLFNLKLKENGTIYTRNIIENYWRTFNTQPGVLTEGDINLTMNSDLVVNTTIDEGARSVCVINSDIDDEENEENDRNEAVLLSRVQLLSMKQIDLLLKTKHGKIQLKTDIHKIQEFNHTLLSDSTDIKDYLQFSFQIFSLETSYLLVTELPHIIKFCINILLLQPNKNISIILDIIKNIQCKQDLSWLCEEDVIELFSPMFSPPQTKKKNLKYYFCCIFDNFVLKNVLKNVLQEYAVTGMKARARQTAVLIAMEIDCDMTETLARINILQNRNIRKKNFTESVNTEIEVDSRYYLELITGKYYFSKS